jgi:hypothetical protein
MTNCCGSKFSLYRGTQDPSQAVPKPRCGNFYYNQLTSTVYIYIAERWISLASNSLVGEEIDGINNDLRKEICTPDKNYYQYTFVSLEGYIDNNSSSIVIIDSMYLDCFNSGHQDEPHYKSVPVTVNYYINPDFSQPYLISDSFGGDIGPKSGGDEFFGTGDRYLWVSLAINLDDGRNIVFPPYPFKP